METESTTVQARLGVASIRSAGHAAVRMLSGERLVGLALLLPAGVVLGSFVVAPMVANLVISFRDRRLTSAAAPFVGFENWDRLLGDGTLVASLNLTLLYSAITVAVTVGLGLLLALALVDRPWLRRFVSTLVVVPIATSLIVASVGWRLLFDVDGGLNQALAWLGIEGPNWLNEPTAAKAVIILVGIWSQAGFALLLYQAALSRLPGSVTDAARLFGCWRGSAWKRRLILPLLQRTTVVVVVVSTMIALRAFDQVYALTDGGPDGSTRTLAFLGWQLGFRFFNLGQGAVAATILVALVLVVVAIEFALLRRTRKGLTVV